MVDRPRSVIDLNAAVLALMVISMPDSCLTVMQGTSDRVVITQSNDARLLDCRRRTADELVVLCDNVNQILDPHTHGLGPMNNLMSLVAVR